MEEFERILEKIEQLRLMIVILVLIVLFLGWRVWKLDNLESELRAWVLIEATNLMEEERQKGLEE